MGNTAGQMGREGRIANSQFFSQCGLGVNYYTVLNRFLSSETLLNYRAVVPGGGGVSEGAVMILEDTPPGGSRTVLTDAHLVLLTSEMLACNVIHALRRGGGPPERCPWPPSLPSLCSAMGELS